MKRLLLVAVLGALVLGATGCDLSPPAATVNGVTISQSTLNAQLSADISNPASQCAALLAAGATASPVGVGTYGDGSTANAVTPAFADNTLEALVLDQLEKQTLARDGVAVTGADVTAATADYEGQLQEQLSEATQDSATPSGCTLSASSAVSSQLPHSFLQRQAATLADQEIFESTVGHVGLGESALEAYYESHLTQVTQLCLNVTVSDTQAQAQAVHDQIAAGASFATASKSADVDQAASPADGALPCEYPSTVSSQLGTALETTIAALKTSALAEPLALPRQSSTGATTTYYLVVQMRARQLIPFATLRSSIRQAILEAHIAVVDSTLNRMVAQAHVTVDARYGGWSAKHGVTVPTPPPPAFVLNASANVTAASTLPLSISPG